MHITIYFTLGFSNYQHAEILTFTNYNFSWGALPWIFTQSCFTSSINKACVTEKKVLRSK